ncbi:MAG TPA: hypothetical protein EYQ20_02495 [candidate division Zixibacteria bacterium]|jgi:hypothetical protein|nr:hypothetical protein [Candidatus Latescibacterota bacterium]HIG45332.1 hypothetical protein [candidate division Zixibacteria bacterium]|tara:strand:+ start:270 stop:500 length:231 start_codon:yes stop_codon:yes gene_type:complete
MLKKNATLFGGCLSAFIAMVALFIAAPNAGADDWGPEVGTKALGFNLKDQNDLDVSLDDLVRTGPVAIVFFRSASW